MKTVTGYRAIGGKVSRVTLMATEADAIRLGNAQAQRKKPEPNRFYFKIVLGSVNIYEVRTVRTKCSVKHYCVTKDPAQAFTFRSGESFETRAQCKRAAIRSAKNRVDFAKRNLREYQRELESARKL